MQKTVKKSSEKSKAKKSKATAQCRLMSAEEKKALFTKYVVPHLGDVKSLTRRYTSNYHDIDENYNHCLAQLYNYIGSYNSSQKLSTWIHICVKRICFHENKRRAEEAANQTDIELEVEESKYQYSNSLLSDMSSGGFMDNISDELLSILMEIPPHRLSPFLLHVQGHRIREITAMEWEQGHLEKRSEDVVQSRIYWARKELRYKLMKNGIER